MALSTSLEKRDIDDRLDLMFKALGHRVRRAILARLSKEPALVTEIAEPFKMALPTVSKHIRVLEDAGLVVRSVDGRIHRCSFDHEPLQQMDTWLEQYRPFWKGTLESLARYAESEEGRAQ